MKKKKPYWEMTTKELAKATRQFDDPAYDPPAIKPTARQLAQQARWRAKKSVRQSKVTLSLDHRLVMQCDEYATDHGITVSQVITHALRQLIQKKSA